jgi:hypothetical protein
MGDWGDEMRSVQFNAWATAALVSVAPLLQACGNVAPWYNDVAVYHTEAIGAPQRDAVHIRTGQRIDQADADWQFYVHDDLDLIHARTCADLALSPASKLRYLAFLHKTSSDDYHLTIRTGLGAQNWSTTFSGVAVPQNEDGLPFAGCPLHMRHLRDELYGIVWVLGDELHSALFNPNKPPGQDLVLNDVVSGFEGTNASRMSLLYYNDEVRLVWSPQDRNRIMTKRGTVSEDGIDFEQASTFTTIAHDTISKAIAPQGVMFVATTDDGTVRLYSTSTGGTNWAEQASCPGQFNDGSMLYADGGGHKRVLTEGTYTALRDFTDCTSTQFPLPVVYGTLSYFPGYPL